MALSAKEFIGLLQQDVRNRHANLNHPFAKALTAGRLTRDHLKVWVCQRYKGITGIGMHNIAPLFIKAPDEGVRRHIWELLGDEGGYAGTEPSHRDWIFRFGAALGLSAEEMEATEPLPETIAVRSFFLTKMHLGSFVEGLASMVCVESQNPDGFAAWARAFRQHYGFQDQDLPFFLGHIEADTGHGGEGWQIIARNAPTDEAQRLVRQTVKESLAVYWLSLDGIHRACGVAASQ